MGKVINALVYAITIPLSACSPSSDKGQDVWTLYKTNTFLPGERFYVATFDSTPIGITATGMTYNFDNCLMATDLFKRQPDRKFEYWCEQGRFRK